MSISCAATKVFESATLTTNSGSFGVVSQADGSYVYGYFETSNDFPFPSVSTWLRSTDDGRTWTSMGTGEGLFGQGGAFPTNIKSNIICTPFYIPASDTAGIAKSTDHGAHWSTVFDVQPAASPNGRLCDIVGIQSYDKTKAVAYGIVDGDGSTPPRLIATSTNAGASWTTHVSWDIGDKFDSCNSMGLAENGTWYAQYTKFGGLNRTSNLARSDNYGASWSVIQNMGSIASPPWPIAWCITCFDAETFAMAGYKGDLPATNAPGVWWSDDGGATITLVPASDINGWPSGSHGFVCQELKRITHDACVLAFGQDFNISSNSPWAISTDQGHTYPIQVTQADAGSLYQTPDGKIVVTKEGALLLPVWQTPDYDTANVALYRAPIVC